MNYLKIMLLSVLLPTLLMANVDYRSCEPQDSGSSKDISNVKDYKVDLGFGTDISFVPDEIELYYKSSDCSGDILSYHSHNGDSLELGKVDFETNFSIGDDFTYYMIIKERKSSDRDHMDWIMHGTILKLNEDFNVSIDDSVSSGDPFKGNANNDVAKFVDGKINFGSSDKPCRYIVKDEALTITTEDESLSGCAVEIFAFSPVTKTKYEWTATVKIEKETDYNNLHEFKLFNKSGQHVGFVKTNLYSWKFSDLDKKAL